MSTFSFPGNLCITPLVPGNILKVVALFSDDARDIF
jgi:hypothetical protein